MSKAKSAVCRSVSTSPQSFLWAFTGLGHVWHLKVLKVGQDCRMWLGVWGPVLHGHSSEWEIFSLWRRQWSWQCPVLSLKIVTRAALSIWWMLSSSVPMSRCCRHSLLKVFPRMVFTSLMVSSSLVSFCFVPLPQWASSRILPMSASWRICMQSPLPSLSLTHTYHRKDPVKFTVQVYDSIKMTKSRMWSPFFLFKLSYQFFWAQQSCCLINQVMNQQLFSCVPSYMSRVHHFWCDFCVCDHFSNPTIEMSHFHFVDGACWVCFCCRHSPVYDMNIRIFWVHVMQCMCATTWPHFILSSKDL